ncbi:MAG TPA: long-chain fatty acid--CoA ligase [Myxococcales bacterium]|nr:long-chain fatty acid--CoA ligase [Myxococcales bacterium]
MARATNLVELYREACRLHADRPFLGLKRENGWSWLTYREFGEMVDAARGGLAWLGVRAGDRVAIIADNCVEWAVAAYATYGLDATFVPMYQSQRPAEWQFILDDCGAKVVLVANESIHQAIENRRQALPQLAHVIGLARPAGAPGSWSELLRAGSAHPVPARSPSPQSVAGFIYTSGTTGMPKGALLSHDNICSNLGGVHDVFPLTPDDRSLSFLPWAHSFGQTVELHMMLSFGGSSAINDNIDNLLANVASVRPTVLVAVPRIFNKLYAVVSEQIAERPPWLRRLIRQGLSSAVRHSRGERLSLTQRLLWAFDEKAVFSKIRQRFGGRLKYVISGSATLARDVAEFIDAVGLPVYEGYGLTETSPIVTANVPGSRRLGSVGRVLPGVRVFIDKSVTGNDREGEIVVFGPNVMIGYHKRPEENARTLTADGGLRTGDLGWLDDDGFLYISGRVKEQFKLENGRYVMPSTLEEGLKLSPYVANAMIYGDGRPWNVALVVIEEKGVRAWAEREKVALGGDLVSDPNVRALVAAELERLAGAFRSFERPRDFALVREDFTIQNGMLTPTLKLKRREVLARYGDVLDALYPKRADALRAE